MEIKNSSMRAGAKVPHLSYVGDADVSKGRDLGAGENHRQLRRPRDTGRLWQPRSESPSTPRSSARDVDDAYTAAGW